MWEPVRRAARNVCVSLRNSPTKTTLGLVPFAAPQARELVSDKQTTSLAKKKKMEYYLVLDHDLTRSQDTGCNSPEEMGSGVEPFSASTGEIKSVSVTLRKNLASIAFDK